MTIKKMGSGAFHWFIGKVEDRDDPLSLGRIRVRIFSYYSENKAILPTDKLPWAYVSSPINSACANGVGISPTGIVVGSVVNGFFCDGPEAQMPIVTGTLVGIPENNVMKHDVPKRARGVKDITKSQLEKEPADPYAARYPYNKVMKSEGGHIIEIDDTPGSERLHTYHKSGTYTEINNIGDHVTKVVGKDYEIVASDKEVFIGGNVDVHIKGNVNILIDGNISTVASGTCRLESKGNMTIIAPRVDINP